MHQTTLNQHHFNPRPPWGGRRHKGRLYCNSPYISIHALRGEGDRTNAGNSRGAHHFNPRPPWGGRRACGMPSASHFSLFQSTPSVGRATNRNDYIQTWIKISIHALRGEGDPAARCAGTATKISIHALRGEGDDKWDIQRLMGHSSFQSTPSVGRATTPPNTMTRTATRFQSTPSVGRATIVSPLSVPISGEFQSTPSVGRATPMRQYVIIALRISIHALRGEGDAVS